jgi:MFS family permease
MVASTGLGYWPLYVLPLLVGQFMESRGYTASQAGLLGSLEIGAIALVTLGASRFLPAGNRRRLAVLGASLALLGQLLSAASHVFLPMALSRTLTGLGEGLAFAVGSAALTGHEEPDRLFGMVFVGRALVGSALAPLLSLSTSRLGVDPFVLMSIVTILAAMVIGLQKDIASPSPATDAALRPRGRQRTPLLKPSAALLGCLLAAGVAFLALLDTVSWTFIERRGLSIGMTPVAVGNVLGLTNFLGMLGAALPIVAGERLGRVLPVLLGTGVGVVAAIVPYQSVSHVHFAVSSAIYVTAFAAVIPYCMGSASTLDREGVWASIVGAMLVAPTAIGPFLSGFVVDTYGFQGIPWALAALGALTAAAFATFYLLDRTRQTRPM